MLLVRHLPFLLVKHLHQEVFAGEQGRQGRAGSVALAWRAAVRVILEKST